MAEPKYIEPDVDGGTVDWTGIIQDLVPVAVGDAVDQRTGDQLTMNSWTMRIKITNGTTLAVMRTRCIIFQWYDNTIPLTTDILNDITDSDAVSSMYNQDTKRKRHIFYDKTYVTTSNAAAAFNSNTILHKEVFIDFKKKGDKIRRVQFDVSATTGVGKLYLMWISDANSATATDQPTVTGHGRLTYIDI